MEGVSERSRFIDSGGRGPSTVSAAATDATNSASGAMTYPMDVHPGGMEGLNTSAKLLPCLNVDSMWA